MAVFPETIGKYRIDSVLGQGAMGVVYKGFDPSLERQVAIKSIRADLLDGDKKGKFLARFQQEARAVGRCFHPNIVAVFDFGEEDGAPYLVMEFVDGQELKQFLRDKISFKLERVVYIVSQILYGLDCAHKQGVIHRDIKPANIMILEDGNVKVADFGIARLETSDLTQAGTILGTPHYMAPEQFMGEGSDQRSDLYSVGALMYELLVGQPPFRGKNTSEVLYKILNTEPNYDQSGREVPARFRALLNKALAKDPKDRFQDVSEFKGALQVVGNTLSCDATYAFDVAAPIDAMAKTAVCRGDGDTLGAEGNWMPDVLRSVEERLTSYIGPIAKLMVKNAARKADSVQDLCDDLTQHIDDEEVRSAFLKDVREKVGPAAGETSSLGGESGITHETLTEVEKEFVSIMGPIAKVLIKREAGKTQSARILCEQLATHIPGSSERDMFLRNVGSLM